MISIPQFQLPVEDDETTDDEKTDDNQLGYYGNIQSNSDDTTATSIVAGIAGLGIAAMGLFALHRIFNPPNRRND